MVGLATERERNSGQKEHILNSLPITLGYMQA